MRERKDIHDKASETAALASSPIRSQNVFAPAVRPQAAQAAILTQRIDNRLLAAPIHGEKIAVERAGAAIGPGADLPFELEAVGTSRDGYRPGVVRAAGVSAARLVAAFRRR